MGKYEALLPNRERVPTEEYQVGERIRCYVKAVEEGPHGPEIILSRADPRFVIKLFQLEVSEINDGTIEIKGIAREPGFRTKMAVYSRDEKVDPVGACVGLRGQRVKNIVRELNNEKVDMIPWDRRTSRRSSRTRWRRRKLKSIRGGRSAQAREDSGERRPACHWPSASAARTRG